MRNRGIGQMTCAKHNGRVTNKPGVIRIKRTTPEKRFTSNEQPTRYGWHRPQASNAGQATSDGHGQGPENA